MAPQRYTQEEARTSLAGLVQAIFALSHLPVLEPTTFTGDPLKFIHWKVSFKALIDQKPLPVSEKFFYLNSEDAYQGAWAVLDDRYGSPFIVQRAFEDRLMKWPQITDNNTKSLREFADFLQGYAEAMPHMKGLSILNDCEENHKLLKKIPEWMLRRWSWIIVEELHQSGNYPSFLRFTEFMQREANIVCNPIASPVFINMKTTRRAKILNTSTQLEYSNSVTQEKPKPPCLFCKNKGHGVTKCPMNESSLSGTRFYKSNTGQKLHC